MTSLFGLAKDQAVQVAGNMPSRDKLVMYSLFKQVECGDAGEGEGIKWKAWVQ